MREFEYFLFENFDADEEANNPQNPRNFLGAETDATLTEVAELPVNSCSYQKSCEKYVEQLIHKLLGFAAFKNTVYAVFGREFATKLIDVNFSSDGISVKGFVGRPDNIRANRNYQNFYLQNHQS